MWGLLRSIANCEVPEFSVGILFIALLMTGGAGLFFYAGVGLAHGWFMNRIDLLIISEEGIGHFGKFTKWDAVKWLSFGCKKKGELMLFFQRKGFLGFDRYLPVSEPLTDVEIEALFHELTNDLAPRYKDLRIG